MVGNLRSKKVIVEQVDTTGFDNNENTRPDDDVLRSAPPEKAELAPAATKPAEKKAEKKEVKKQEKKAEKKPEKKQEKKAEKSVKTKKK